MPELIRATLGLHFKPSDHNRQSVTLFVFSISSLLPEEDIHIKITLKEPKNTLKAEKDYKIGWFETFVSPHTFTCQVDHYNFNNNDKFEIKYLYSDQFYTKDGPGFIWEIASLFGAYVLFGEHRYYGESIPYKNGQNNISFEYLTAEQAMLDYVSLIDYLFPPKTKVIVFGGSYGGMLAAWMRMKYPAYITGALASSAPILMFEGYSDCGSPFVTITKNFRTEGPNSPENIKTLWNILNDHNTKYLDWLWNELNLCNQNERNIELLIQNITNLFFAASMVNYPSPSTLLVPLPAYPLRVTPRSHCQAISQYFNGKGMSEEELVRALALSLNLYFNNTGTRVLCFDFTDTYGSVDLLPWGYQMDLYMCSREGVDNMFPPMEYNSSRVNKECSELYGVTPRRGFIPLETNVRDLSSFTNIIFSNGDMDPWSGGGFYRQDNEGIHVVVIEGGAHHVDLRESSDNDPPSVVLARRREIEIIQGWLN
ncbi:lysosomal Pro-X carboxypeptidase-like [Octopus sinensis]|uniref:Lysosomal Pro-X carboxypeptidase-like n=1 Tax=Octopus sinensis TaxID=2607531 RepID=A0A7E6ELA8_9MOLL|nr:lysosomal Pro-X carboxypeptidase-like [Octopus sinensis]